MSLRATVRPSSAAGPNFAAIWHMPGQTVRQSGTCQAKLCGHLARARPNFAAIWYLPGHSCKRCHESAPQPQLKDRRVGGTPAIGQQPKNRNNCAAIWCMPGQTLRPSGTRQAKLCGYHAKLCGYHAKTVRLSGESWAKTPPRG